MEGDDCMKTIMKNLLVLQDLELHGTRTLNEQPNQLDLIRSKVPESILTHFDRWIDRGKKAVAIVRGGVCCECHLKVATGVLVNLAAGEELERCGNCGRLLYLAVEEPMASPPLVEKCFKQQILADSRRSRVKSEARACVRKSGPHRRPELVKQRPHSFEQTSAKSDD